MPQPLVSILIPFKNTEKFISECLHSILDQTYTNWEILAINDHSTDTSKQIVTNFCERDHRIKQYDNSGQGIIPALQKAYSYSKGSFITRMDADDIMAKYKLETMVVALQQYGKKHLALGLVKYFSEHGIGNGYARYEKWLNKLTEKGTNYSEIYKECVIASPCWMLHREDFETCGAFNSDRYPEDYDLSFRFYEQKLTCIPAHKTLHYWRDYQTRTSRTSAHYAQNYFLDIKMYYFLKLERHEQKRLVVWGAGNKGKTIAKYLINKSIPFHWVCDNPNKIGKDIYGQTLKHYSYLENTEHVQLIITVANEEAQTFICDYLKELKQIATEDYFFFLLNSIVKLNAYHYLTRYYKRVLLPYTSITIYSSKRIFLHK